VQVNRLRRKIEVDPANPLHLQTVRGLGYKLAIDR
jgi:two-component system phosphate regulon response regulator OmpR